MYDWSTGAEGAPTAAASVSVVVERMYDWSRTVCRFWSREYSCFSCCWKDVRLKPESTDLPSKLKRFQLLLKGCTIEACSLITLFAVYLLFQLLLKGCTIEALATYLKRIGGLTFQLLLKGCTIEAWQGEVAAIRRQVSVVVGRMYDWSTYDDFLKIFPEFCFSCCWKDVRLKPANPYDDMSVVMFQLLLKGCTIEA